MTDVSWLARIVLLLMVAASAGLFWWRLRKVVASIRLARPTPDFELGSIGQRIGQFLWEVALQGKLIA